MPARPLTNRAKKKRHPKVAQGLKDKAMKLCTAGENQKRKFAVRLAERGLPGM